MGHESSLEAADAGQLKKKRGFPIKVLTQILIFSGGIQASQDFVSSTIDFFHWIYKVHCKPTQSNASYSKQIESQSKRTSGIANPSGTIRCNTVRYAAVQYGTVRYSTVPYGTARCSTGRYGTVQYGTVRYGTVRRGTVRYGAIGYGTVQPID